MSLKSQSPAPVIRFPSNPVRANSSGWRWFAVITGAAVAAIAVIVTSTAILVARQGAREETRTADAIVVFGAAEYAGRPSPVWRARLDHAYALYRRGIAPVVITTGGAGSDPSYTEGGVGRDYLLRRGVPDHDLVAETQSDDTAESAERVSAILRANDWHSVVAVSDAYHLYRIKKFLERKGVIAYASPRPDSVPHTWVARIIGATREAISLLFWRVVGT